MKLSKALKEKNKLTKKITELQKLVSQYNSVIVGNPRAIDVAEKMTELDALTDQLVTVKAAIAAANQPINRHILAISELRSSIAFLRKLDVREGQVNERYGTTTAVYEVTVDRKSIISRVEAKETEIEKLQELIDAFNHSTEVDINL